MKKPHNLLNYIYPNNEMVEIPGALLYSLMQILNTVKDQETKQVMIDNYPVKSKKVFDKDNKDFLEEVTVEWEKYPSAQSYFSQTPHNATSMLGCMALDMLMLVQQAHSDNIDAGIAKEIGTIQTKEENAEIKLS